MREGYHKCELESLWDTRPALCRSMTDHQVLLNRWVFGIPYQGADHTESLERTPKGKRKKSSVCARLPLVDMQLQISTANSTWSRWDQQFILVDVSLGTSILAHVLATQGVCAHSTFPMQAMAKKRGSLLAFVPQYHDTTIPRYRPIGVRCLY